MNEENEDHQETTKDIKKKLKKKPIEKTYLQPFTSKDLLSTGSTLLNLACSGRVDGGFCKGRYVLMIGDSGSSKTWIALTTLAEASISPNFSEYRLIYDGPERGAMMDMERYFGKTLTDRLEPPSFDHNEAPLSSSTIQEFYYHLDCALDREMPFIYVLDSIDAISSDQEGKKAEERNKVIKKAMDKGEEVKDLPGSMTDGKAKENSANLRRVVNQLPKTGSILFIINQTRDNIGWMQSGKTHSGGRSLEFYATLVFWSSIKKKLTKVVNEKKRKLGIEVEIKFTKNRLTGDEPTVTIPIYKSSGLDDVGSCVDYLIEEGHWNKSGQTINAGEIDFKGSRENLIQKIEDEELEKKLKGIVAQVWDDIQEQCTVKRKNRYA